MNEMEQYWELVLRLGSFAGLVLEGCYFCRFVQPFLKKNCAAKWTGTAYFAVTLLQWMMPFAISQPDLQATAAAFCVMYLLDRRNAAQKIFLAVTMCLLLWMEYGFSLVPWNACFTFVLNKPYMQQRERLQFAGYVLTVILHCVIQCFLLHWMVGLIHRVYSHKSENMTKKELGLLFSALLTVFAGRFILFFSSEAYLADTGSYIWNVHGEYNWIKTIYQILTFLAVFFMILVYQKIRESQQKEMENAVLAEQAKRLGAHIREVEELYGQLRGLRHDMGNHVAVLERLFLNHEPEELKRYIHKWKEEFLQAGYTAEEGIRSGNPVTDIILEQKKRYAQDKGIDFLCEFCYPQGTKLDAFDVSVILNNALDNAFEAAACSPAPCVQIRAWCRKNVFLIEVENRFCGRLILDAESGLPESTKQDRKNHGFGLVNIRRVAQKYFGDVEIVQEGERVRVVVMLMLEKKESG